MEGAWDATLIVIKFLLSLTHMHTHKRRDTYMHSQEYTHCFAHMYVCTSPHPHNHRSLPSESVPLKFFVTPPPFPVFLF